jgi:hypothetical protein
VVFLRKAQYSSECPQIRYRANVKSANPSFLQAFLFDGSLK